MTETQYPMLIIPYLHKISPGKFRSDQQVFDFLAYVSLVVRNYLFHGCLTI